VRDSLIMGRFGFCSEWVEKEEEEEGGGRNGRRKKKEEAGALVPLKKEKNCGEGKKCKSRQKDKRKRDQRQANGSSLPQIG